MKQDISSLLLGTYKAINSSLVYNKAEACSMFALEFSRKSTRNKAVKSDFTACDLSNSRENFRHTFMFPVNQQVTEFGFSVWLL